MRFLILSSVAWLVCAAAPPSSLLKASLPADGSTVAVNPHWVRLYFRTNVIVHELSVSDTEGRHIPLRWSRPEDPEDQAEGLLPDFLPDATYVVAWNASDANGMSEDVPATEWGTPKPPNQGRITFQLKKKR